MRILQLIDSLRPGGAEKMAVCYANALSRTDASFLCCTRLQGSLMRDLLPEVGYVFLGKKMSLDLLAFLKLRSFIMRNRIELLQVHGSSFFLAVLMKKALPELKLVWHDHYGKDIALRNSAILRQSSKNFDGVICVSSSLKLWAEGHLYCSNVILLKNFLPQLEVRRSKQVMQLSGTGFKIICVANLRPQKDHHSLLRAFQLLIKEDRDVTLHLVGRDAQDTYSEKIKDFIADAGQGRIFFYGEKSGVAEILKQADLGVLSSTSEGLPLALLEYARAGLAVVCTAVGECPAVVQKSGKLVPPGNTEALADAIKFYMECEEERKRVALEFQQRVLQEYSEEAVIHQARIFFLNLIAAGNKLKAEVL